MPKKVNIPKGGPKTGDQFIEKARRRGANVAESPDRNGFIKISTPVGSTYVTSGDQPLDPRTRKNLKHWFRLLGLLIIIIGFIFMIDFMWGVMGLPPIA